MYLHEKIRHLLKKVQPEKKLGVIALISIDDTLENCRVLIQKPRDPNLEPDELSDFTKITVSLAKIRSENWGIQDLVSFNWRGKVNRIASKEELTAFGANTKVIYERFTDWTTYDRHRQNT